MKPTVLGAIPRQLGLSLILHSRTWHTVSSQEILFECVKINLGCYGPGQFINPSSDISWGNTNTPAYAKLSGIWDAFNE